MEGMQGRTRDQRRLVGDPEMLDRFKSIGKDDSLRGRVSVRFVRVMRRSNRGVPYCPFALGIRDHTSSPIRLPSLRARLLVVEDSQRSARQGFLVSS
jgi:hypothetical protein